MCLTMMLCNILVDWRVKMRKYTYTNRRKGLYRDRQITTRLTENELIMVNHFKEKWGCTNTDIVINLVKLISQLNYEYKEVNKKLKSDNLSVEEYLKLSIMADCKREMLTKWSSKLMKGRVK